MAFTVSMIAKTVMGDHRVHAMRVTTDSAENTIDTGLSYVDWISVSNDKCTDAVYCIKVNAGTTSTARVGILGCSGMASGDIFFITAYGR